MAAEFHLTLLRRTTSGTAVMWARFGQMCERAGDGDARIGRARDLPQGAAKE